MTTPTDHMTIAEIIHDFATRQGDLTDRRGREDLAAILERRVVDLRLVRQVESDMAEQALKAWRSADARRGLSDHEALLVHADALTRWSERFRMAFDGDDYRDDRDHTRTTETEGAK